MALTKINPAATFEQEGADALVETNVETATAETTTSTAVAVPANRAVSAFANLPNAVAAAKDAVKVEFDTLPNIIANNGNFLTREDKKSLGDTVTFELLSWQDTFVVQPGDDKAPKETVKYSDDGVTCSDGTSCKEHLEDLRNMGYEKASIKERSVVVGSVKAFSKNADFNDSLVQFDLSPKSRGAFKRYQLTVLNLQRLGKAKPEETLQMKGICRVTSSGGNTYTIVDFEMDKS